MNKRGIKLAAFDLDGVLFDTRHMHFDTLNRALESFNHKPISIDDHINTFDGLPTKKKLEIIGFNKFAISEISAKKQKLTSEWLCANVKPDSVLLCEIKRLCDMNIAISVVSNAIPETVKQFLLFSGMYAFVTNWLTISNDVSTHPKPSPEPYLQSMIRAGVSPDETIVFEDSPVGCYSALASGATVFHVAHPSKTHQVISRAIDHIKNRHPSNRVIVDTECNVVIPMAGQGSRFKEAGYDLPKPLIDVCGRPMIRVVTDSIGIDAQHTFLVREEHLTHYGIRTLLTSLKPGSKIIGVPELTQGAACTVLLAENTIDSNKPLLIANSDQDISWNYPRFMQKMLQTGADGGILTFKNSDPKWSFALVGEDGFVSRVAEKEPISNDATVGVYYWKHGSDFVHYARQMMNKNIRVNGEFYVCPVFNEAIQDGLKFITFEVDSMSGLGTPDDLETYKATRETHSSPR